MKKMERFSKNKFLLGNKIYLCDFVFGSWLIDIVDNDMAYGREMHKALLDSNPWLKLYCQNFRTAISQVLEKRGKFPI